MSEPQNHVNPASPVPCVKCGETTACADEYVGHLYCAACGYSWEAGREQWERVHAHDEAWFEGEERKQAAIAEREKTARDLEAWESFCADRAAPPPEDAA